MAKEVYDTEKLKDSGSEHMTFLLFFALNKGAITVTTNLVALILSLFVLLQKGASIPVVR